MYKIITNEKTILTFRNQYQNFQIYKSFNQNKTDIVVNIDELEKYIVQTNISKQSRNYIHFNPFKEGHKTKEYSLLPHTFLLDIDGKSIKQRDTFIKDMGCKTYEQSLKKCYDLLKNDDCCLYIDYSQSNNGLHCLFTIISNYYTENENIEIKDTSIIDTLMNENFNVMLEHLRKYNLNFYNNESIDYIDKSLKKITTGVFSSNGKGFYINPKSNILYFEIDETIIKTDKPTTKIDIEKIKELNNNYSNKLFMYGKDNSKKVLNEIEHIFKHYDERLLFSLKYVDVKYKKKYYGLFYMFYEGKSLKKHLNSFETFDKYLNSLKDKFILPLSSLIGFDFDVRNSNGMDFFNNKYNESLVYEHWINEKKEHLFNIFDTKDYIVLKSQSGSGKSTLIFDYINESFKTLNTIVLVSPKNSLLNQQIVILRKKYPNIRIIENFGKKRVKNGNNGKCLILSSTPKIKLIENYDLLIIDEIQNLVSYSNTILSNVDKSKKTILISATPEPYLTFEKGYYYVNLMKKNTSKKNMNVIVSNNYKKTLSELVKKDEKTLIFWNNIDLCKDVERTLNIDFKYLNSVEKDEHRNKCIENECLYHSHYFTTSYISDGINFKNDSWDKLIIVDNGLSPFEIYQITNRFRQCSPGLYLITKGKQLTYKNIDKFDEHLKGLNDFNYFEKTIKELRTDEQLLNKIPQLNNYVQKIENQYILKDIDNEYQLNIDSIKKDIYDKLFNSFYSVYRNVWENSIKYYFKVNKTFEIVESNESKTFEKNDTLKDIFKENHYELIMLSFDYDVNLMKLRKNEHYDIVKDNITYFRTVVKRCNELKDIGYDYKEYFNEVCSKNQNYTRFIHRKKIESVDSGKQNDNNSKLYYDRQEFMLKIVLNSGIVKQYSSSVQTFNYFTINDLLDYLIKNKHIYIKFYFSKSYDFELTSKGLSRYIELIKRHFEKKIVKINNKTIKVFMVKKCSSKELCI